MLKKMFSAIKNLQPTPIDPSIFNDSVAEITPWTPAQKGGANFCTHRLKQINHDRMEFKSPLGAKLLYAIFLAIGIVVLGIFAYKFLISTSFKPQSLILLFVGAVFTAIGGCLLYFGTQPIVFSKINHLFWKGRKEPGMVFSNDQIKVLMEINHIYALQLISEYCSSDKSSYYSYELNLVLGDGERINVIDHGNKKNILEDAQKLAEFLNKPLWSAIN